jgi:hypothetical protein
MDTLGSCGLSVLFDVCYYVTTVFSTTPHKLNKEQQCNNKWQLFAFLYSISLFSVIFNYQLLSFTLMSLKTVKYLHWPSIWASPSRKATLLSGHFSDAVGVAL